MQICEMRSVNETTCLFSHMTQTCYEVPVCKQESYWVAVKLSDVAPSVTCCASVVLRSHTCQQFIPAHLPYHRVRTWI